MPVFVIAPSARIAEMVARGKVTRRNDYRYVHSAQQVYGTRDVTVYCYGGGGRWSTQQWDAYDYLKRNGATFIDVAESELQP